MSTTALSSFSQSTGTSPTPTTDLSIFQLLDHGIRTVQQILILYTSSSIIPLTEIPLTLQPILVSLRTVFSTAPQTDNGSRGTTASIPQPSEIATLSSTSVSPAVLYTLILHTRRLLWDIIHSGKWMNVSIHVRLWYLLCACYEASYRLHTGSRWNDEKTKNHDDNRQFLKDAIQCIDIGYMLGPPPPRSFSLDSTLDASLTTLTSLVSNPGTANSNMEDMDAVVNKVTVHVYVLANHIMQSLTTLNSLSTVPSTEQDIIRDISFDTTSLLSLSSPSPTAVILPIIRLRQPSLMDFYQNYMVRQQPVIITGIVDQWPAYKKESNHYWGNLNYLRSIGGLRTVPIELGATYMDPNWSTKLITLEQFIQCYIHNPSIDTEPFDNNNTTASLSSSSSVTTVNDRSKKGYLAQFPLFDHIPALRQDIRIPDYCGLVLPSSSSLTGLSETDKEDNNAVTSLSSSSSSLSITGSISSSIPSTTETEPQILAWFGPASTVSNLHYDKPYNLLSQIIGYKRVRLYSPQYSKELYPYEGLMNNTSPINPEVYDTAATKEIIKTINETERRSDKYPTTEPPLKHHRTDPVTFDTISREREEERINQEKYYPSFTSSLPHYDLVLQPGEILYIPPGWWHHVRSLSISFSVSFWWQ